MHAPRRVLLQLATILCAACAAPTASSPAVFDVRAFGASGRRDDDARPALQAAIDACAAAGGGRVLVPPGEYTSGGLELKSHVALEIEAGATVFAAKGRANFPSEALFHGIDLEQVALLGRGTIDGCAAYEWRAHDHDDRYIWPNLVAMRAAGKSLQRSYPSADSAGNLVRLVRCKDVAIRGLSLERSPSWNIHLWGCERIVIDGVSIRSSLREGVWSDGIDPDGCKDLRISNCTIETGDDALVFYSTDLFGPARPCEDVTVTNCRLTSSSSALKFGDGNENAIRRVTVSNCTIADSNRGVAFMIYDGGIVEDVVLSDLVIECTRRDWFWWGDGEPFYFDVRPRSELDERLRSPDEPPAGRVRNVLIRNVIARGTGSSSLSGHATSPLENITFDGLLLTLAHDRAAPYERAEHAFAVRHARDFTLRGVELRWSEPASAAWRSALACEDVAGLRVEGLVAHPAPAAATAALSFTNVSDALLTGCRAVAGTGEFLRVAGPRSRDIQLLGNDLRAARSAWSLASDAMDTVHSSGDLAPNP
jgi:hypothetical protein